MSGKRKPLLSSPKDSSSSSGDDEPPARVAGVGYSSPSPTLKSDYDRATSPSSTASGPVYVRLPGFDHHGHEIAAVTEGARHLTTAAVTSSAKGKKKKALLSAVFPSSNNGSGSGRPTTSGGRNRVAPAATGAGPPSGGKEVPVPSALLVDVTSSDDRDAQDNAATTTTTTPTGNSGETTFLTLAAESKAPPQSTKTRTKRDPLPMKLRALPLSFWQEPNVVSRISPGNMYTKLPPLTNKDSPDGAEMESTPGRMAAEVEWDPEADVGDSSQRRDGKRMVRVSNTDWLYKLFEGLEGHDKVPGIKRGRPKKTPTAVSPREQGGGGDDPCMANVSAWPLLPWCKKNSGKQQATLTMVALRDRDKSVSLPALHADHRHYSQLLSEVVVKL